MQHAYNLVSLESIQLVVTMQLPCQYLKLQREHCLKVEYML